MKLKQYTVKEFQSVWDSGAIKIEDKITCLVGKNEAGKTALLKALYRTNPVTQDDNVFDITYDYPKREVEDYSIAVDSNEREKAVVVSCEYELEDKDMEHIHEHLGSGTLKQKTFQVETYYGDDKSRYVLDVDEGKARQHLASNPNLVESLKSKLRDANDWNRFAAVLNKEVESIGAISEIKNLVKNINEQGLSSYIAEKWIQPHIPKFLYFDEYYQMQGCTNLDALIGRESQNQLENSDCPLIGLINLARLDLHTLTKISNTTELKNKLESASNYLTKQIISYWSQNKHIRMIFDVRPGMSSDPEGMRQGMNIWSAVYDSVHLASTPLSSRSKGFVWFFSFIAWYEDIKRKKGNVILLLDEPGLSLHGRAQGDLLRYFEEGLSEHQLIYSTHSPFMIDPRRFERIRIVQDSGIDTDKQLPKEEDGTKVLSDVFAATSDSLFPLQGALGYEIQQTLFVGPNVLIVEGPSDMLFLSAISGQMEREGRIGLSEKWVITPVGGSGKIPTFVSLLTSQRGLNIATLLDVQNKDRQQIEVMYQKKMLKKKQVLTYAEFLNRNEADIEDIFERNFYINLVNQEFKKELADKQIEVKMLNEKEPRTVRAIEKYLEKNPFISGSFSHYRPARYFMEHVDDLWRDLPTKSKDYFEDIFKRLNEMLK